MLNNKSNIICTSIDGGKQPSAYKELAEDRAGCETICLPEQRVPYPEKTDGFAARIKNLGPQ